jgi:DNA repair protein RadD
MQRFKDGTTRVLCNVDLFSEGVDVPAIEAVALLRPTQSLALYMQQVGRALRPAEGKEYAVILDHAGNCRRFGMPDDERTWTLEGRKKGSRNADVTLRSASARAATRRLDRSGLVQGVRVQVRDARSRRRGGRGQSAGGRLDRGAQDEARRPSYASRREAETLDDLIKLAKFRGYKNPEKWAHKIFSHRLARAAAHEAVRKVRAGLI